jgi:hypothetical protein
LPPEPDSVISVPESGKCIFQPEIVFYGGQNSPGAAVFRRYYWIFRFTFRHTIIFLKENVKIINCRERWLRR